MTNTQVLLVITFQILHLTLEIADKDQLLSTQFEV